jgi:hypothetical protein
MMRLLLALLALALSAPALGRDIPGVVQHRTPPAALDPGKAYLLFRSSTAKNGLARFVHVFLRIPAEAEVAAYEVARQTAYDAALPALTKQAEGGPVPTIDAVPFTYEDVTNLFPVRAGFFLEDGDMRTFLVEVPPGTYVLYGSTIEGDYLQTCNCLGTVKFEAPPGRITQLGSLYLDKVLGDSPLPHLEDNRGPSMSKYIWPLGQALVPAGSDTLVPATLSAFPVVPAEFHAVGIFHEPGVLVNRLAPIPGILGYARGKVIDLRTGQPAK